MPAVPCRSRRRSWAAAILLGAAVAGPGDVRANHIRGADAEFLRGWRLESGAGGTRPDYGAAYAAYCGAARQGHPGAALRLAVLHLYGAGAPHDRLAGAAWVREAARRGNRVAAGLLPQFRDVPAQPARCAAPEPAVRDVPAAGFARPGPSASHHEIHAMVRALAPAYGLAPELVLAIITAESAFQPRAVSPKGAQGLMQLIPATAERFGVARAFDPQDNVRGGMAYLRWLLSYFRGDVALAVAAYNAGEGAVDRYRGVPPFEETQRYVRRVLGLYPHTTHPFDPAAAPASRMLVGAK